jgi:hypothetical protein
MAQMPVYVQHLLSSVLQTVGLEGMWHGSMEKVIWFTLYFLTGRFPMSIVRNSILTVACVGLLSTVGMGMPAEGQTKEGGRSAKQTHPQGQESPETMGQASSDDRGMTAEGKKGDRRGNEPNPTDPVGHESSAPTEPNTGESMTSGATTHESQTISGEIMSVQGETFVVKDATGKEVSLHVDKSTKKSGSPKKGDRIEAEVNSAGHALSFKKSEKESAR